MQNKYGLSEKDLAAIAAVLTEYPAVEEALIFGSRAKGNFKNGSDVDITLKGGLINFDVIASISYDLNEETSMPYKFDVVNYHSIQEPALVEHIKRVGVCFYKRTDS